MQPISVTLADWHAKDGLQGSQDFGAAPPRIDIGLHPGLCLGSVALRHLARLQPHHLVRAAEHDQVELDACRWQHRYRLWRWIRGSPWYTAHQSSRQGCFMLLQAVLMCTPSASSIHTVACCALFHRLPASGCMFCVRTSRLTLALRQVLDEEAGGVAGLGVRAAAHAAGAIYHQPQLARQRQRPVPLGHAAQQDMPCLLQRGRERREAGMVPCRSSVVSAGPCAFECSKGAPWHEGGLRDELLGVAADAALKRQAAASGTSRFLGQLHQQHEVQAGVRDCTNAHLVTARICTYETRQCWNTPRLQNPGYSSVQHPAAGKCR
jgi:hypothetical protein